MYLFFSNPRTLDIGDDPLDDWFGRTNALYYDNEIVMLPAIVRPPIVFKTKLLLTIARFGIIVNHEMWHIFGKKCTKTERPIEDVADILALSSLLSIFSGDFDDIKKFFIMYGQFYCHHDPDRMYLHHNSARNRVNHPIKYGSSELIEKFNNAFECNNNLLKTC